MYWLQRLGALYDRPACVIGILSGTSADAIDASVCRITPSQHPPDQGYPQVELVHHVQCPHDPNIHDWIEDANSLPARRLAELHQRLGRRFAEVCLEAIQASGLEPSKVDLVGSHGQTLYHHSRVPGADRCTLQVGDADQIAELTGLPVVSDFRSRDIAAGGEGAPITPIADLVLFSPFGPHGRRAVLNLGGIANVTLLDNIPSRMMGFDIGPGNALLDRLARRLTGGCLPFDVDGRLAATGQVNNEILKRLLDEDPFIHRPPPKSSGFETYGDAMVEELVRWHGRADVDLLATLSEFTAQAVAKGISEHIDAERQPAEVIVAGGGALNPDLLRRLRDAIAPCVLTCSDALGVPVKAREAMSFAILAHRTVRGEPSTWPNLTGAFNPVVLGKLSLPTTLATFAKAGKGAIVHGS